MINVTFIINGRLSNSQQVQEQILEVVGDGMQISALLTRSSQDAIDLAEQAILDGASFVIAVGGDGMVNEVVNGYMKVPKELRCKVALGVFPAGKGNDYVRSLRTSGELKELFALIKGSKTRAVDLGLVTCVGLDGRESKRYFNNIADVGLAGYIVQDIDLSGTFINGFFTYQKAIIQTFLTYRHIKVRLESAELNWEGRILSIVMAKGKFFGSGLCIAPHASIDDGKLGLVLIGDVSLWDYIKNLGKLKKGLKLEHPEASYHTIGGCKITPVEGQCPIDMDGEFIGYAPMEVEVVPAAVRFVAP
jgi:YegS/Rv2252/BmrU family lipid kinase